MCAQTAFYSPGSWSHSALGRGGLVLVAHHNAWLLQSTLAPLARVLCRHCHHWEQNHSGKELVLPSTNLPSQAPCQNMHRGGEEETDR